MEPSDKDTQASNESKQTAHAYHAEMPLRETLQIGPSDD